MNRLRLLLLLFCPLPLPAQSPAAPPEAVLAGPLRKFDRDRDGKLTGDEVTLARQAHNRGGREAEPRPGKWKETLQRLEREFTARNLKAFDRDASGILDGREKEELGEVWAQIAEKITGARRRITEKYDRNDDGELAGPEREASRAESEQTRRGIEEQCLREWRDRQSAAPPPAR